MLLGCLKPRLELLDYCAPFTSWDVMVVVVPRYPMPIVEVRFPAIQVAIGISMMIMVSLSFQLVVVSYRQSG